MLALRAGNTGRGKPSKIRLCLGSPEMLAINAGFQFGSSDAIADVSIRFSSNSSAFVLSMNEMDVFLSPTFRKASIRSVKALSDSFKTAASSSGVT